MGNQPRQPDRDSNSAATVELRQLSAAQQARLDELMSANSQGRLSETEREELTQLVHLTQQIALENARRLTGRA